MKNTKFIKNLIQKSLVFIIVSAILISGLVIANTNRAYADSNIPDNQIDIYVNGKVITNYYDNQRAFFDNNGRTQVPLRTLAETMGFKVDWDGKTQSAVIPLDGGKKIVVKLYSNKVQTPNGEITMDTVAVTINGRTYVPVRFVAEALGWKVGYKQLHDNSGASKGKATHMVTVDKEGINTDTSTNSTGNLLENNIVGVKDLTDIKTDPALKAYWESLDQSKFTLKNINGRVFYKTPTGTIKIYDNDKLGYVVELNNWDTTTQDIVKNILTAVCQNPKEVYERLNKTYSVLHDKTRTGGLSDEWVSENLGTFTTGNVKYTIEDYQFTLVNK